MAKTRSRSRKTAAKRVRSAKRPRAAVRRPKPKHIELRPIRTKLKSHVNQLGAAIAGARTTEPQLEEALKRMSRWLDDINDICGPNMMIPLP